MVHAGCVLVASIHPSRTRVSGSFESVPCNSCVHRLDLGLYSHLKEFWGNGVKTHVSSKGKIPFTGRNFPQKDQTHNAASSRTVSPTHYQQAVLAPRSVPQTYCLLLGHSSCQPVVDRDYNFCQHLVEVSPLYLLPVKDRSASWMNTMLPNFGEPLVFWESATQTKWNFENRGHGESVHRNKCTKWSVMIP